MVTHFLGVGGDSGNHYGKSTEEFIFPSLVFFPLWDGVGCVHVISCDQITILM